MLHLVRLAANYDLGSGEGNPVHVPICEVLAVSFGALEMLNWHKFCVRILFVAAAEPRV